MHAVSAGDVGKRIAEYAGIGPAPADDPVAQAEAALFIEDVFDLKLTDDDMSVERLGTFEAMERLVLERLAGRGR
jgi:hypothetical protein